MRLYVIRHGESENNLKLCWTGWLDVPLTDKGRDDARKAGTFLQGVAFDKVYASDLCRAVETARIALPGRACETSPLLREINVGSLQNTPIGALSPETLERTARLGYAEFGGESKPELLQRVHSFLQQVETLECETVAAFCHGGFLRGTLDTVLGVPLPREKVACHNCAIAVYDFSDGLWQLHSWVNLS